MDSLNDFVTNYIDVLIKREKIFTLSNLPRKTETKTRVKRSKKKSALSSQENCLISQIEG